MAIKGPGLLAGHPTVTPDPPEVHHKMSAGGIRRPVQIEEFKTAIGDMSGEELTHLKQEIQNSILHLNRSNARLNRYVAKLEGKVKVGDEDDEDDEELQNIEEGDLQLYHDSLRENEILLKNYDERLEALHQESLYRASGGKKPST